jgi:hypothetical protein
MQLLIGMYHQQAGIWPASGRHILAQYDDETIIVYQAYRESTGRFAAEYGYFEKDFSYSRMSWVKPNFLWMMYRSGWGTKEAQVITLALHLRRSFFDGLLSQAIPSSWDSTLFATREDWSAAVRKSNVRIQWDPDHDPHGRPLPRKAIQLGLRGEALESFGRQELIAVHDISDFVAAQRMRLGTGGRSAISTPVERVYLPQDRALAARLGLET